VCPLLQGIAVSSRRWCGQFIGVLKAYCLLCPEKKVLSQFVKDLSFDHIQKKCASFLRHSVLSKLYIVIDVQLTFKLPVYFNYVYSNTYILCNVLVAYSSACAQETNFLGRSKERCGERDMSAIWWHSICYQWHGPAWLPAWEKAPRPDTRFID